jgi:hypothetical protein
MSATSLPAIIAGKREPIRGSFACRFFPFLK